MWKWLAEKGKIATIIGFILTIPVNGWAVYHLYKGTILEQNQLWTVISINIVGMIWFILPSKISIKSGKGLEIVVED